MGQKWHDKASITVLLNTILNLLLLAANSSISALAIAWLNMSILSCCEVPWDSSLLDEPFESKTTQEESPGTENTVKSLSLNFSWNGFFMQLKSLVCVYWFATT